MTIAELTDLKVKAPEEVDEDGFTSVWSIAAATCGDDIPNTRELAGKLLGFLCKKGCEFVVISSTDADYLDDMFERDKKLLYDWKAESEMVDVLAQHAKVPCETFMLFLENQKFKHTTKYSPKRSDRVDWFTTNWNVG